MTASEVLARLRSSLSDPLPLPGSGKTALRHRRLIELGRLDLSLARLAEAHWDAVAILVEAGREPVPGAIYGVWASEIPGQAVHFESKENIIYGTKMFCSGAGLIDRALVTVDSPNPLLFDIDLKINSDLIQYDHSQWKTSAFASTHTSMVSFKKIPVTHADVLCEPGWYLTRPGFWHGACGPAACWAGGAIGLVDFALSQRRNDPHTMAHLGAMQALAWALNTYLDTAGQEIDTDHANFAEAHMRALTVRHLVEQASTEILRRLPRAYGPHPLAMDEAISQRYQELDLYLRQSHAERDLEALGRCSIR